MQDANDVCQSIDLNSSSAVEKFPLIGWQIGCWKMRTLSGSFLSYTFLCHMEGWCC